MSRMHTRARPAVLKAALLVGVVLVSPLVRGQTPATPPPPMPMPLPPPTAMVELRSSGSPTRIALRPPPGMGMPVALCETPCAVPLPLGPVQLVAEGDGQRPVPFGILVTPNGVSVRVRPGSKAMHGSGIALVTTGLLAVALATVALGIGAYSVARAGGDSFVGALVDATVAYAAIGTGVVVGLAGIVLIIPGGVLWGRADGALERADPLRPRISLGPMGIAGVF